MEQTKKNLLILHFTVLIWGFTGVLGKVISIDAVPLVWYRVLIATSTLLAWFLITKKNIKISKKQFLQFFFTGAIVAIHWIFFFHAIKVSTVSVTLVCLSSFTLFTAILEPLIKKQPIQMGDILIGLIIILGIYMIFKFEGQYTLGIIFGLLAAVASSLFSTINSTLVQKSEPSIIGFYELVGGLFWITLYRLYDGSLINSSFNLNINDWIYIGILGTLCTSVAYVAGVSVMRTLSAFRVALVTNLEPVYGILLAFIFFKDREQMTAGFYVGAAIILSAIFLYPIYKKRKNKL
ncbi:drug/metabolite transporter (DMT)-like permease [Pedobacter psychrotolerans]|uniref:Permease n=1 Tax=Pedobacter psychrotolerans TaxID=1843235 RepID=A0A4R2H516_9SPHI|nr:DMT family transporter [Pedobacter psychrotolerans]TCO20742.1 drug/metabolite transporter (DMT)-like permease [Pedobacter psychrotolerans]GGE67752.1 permease [Pedobacter psychrotolerans]